jgi:glycerol-3-phosphate dehydrogenase
MGRQTLHIDIAILGGGIAGLWTLNQLRNRGYSAVLFERCALGSYQTVGSQGMIHGGVKYALAGAWSGSSQTISAMPDVWRKCLAGQGKVDLRGCRVLSEHFYLWSSAALQSRVASFFASKLLRGRVRKLGAGEYPAALADPAFSGEVYRLTDLVVDVPSLLDTLARAQRDAIFAIDWQHASLHREGRRAVLALADCTVVPERLLLTAGAGNESLIEALGSRSPPMQRRPLQQVLVRHEFPESFYGHCMGGNPSPRLSISSHRCLDGRPVWYLGGDLATAGADDEPEGLIDRARAELRELMPWIDFGRTDWATLRLDRAEPRQSALVRPDCAFVGSLDSVDNALAAWPTKLTLAPDLADQIERQLVAANVLPRHRPDPAPLAGLGRPPVASAYWDTLLP